MEELIPKGQYCYSYTGKVKICNRVLDKGDVVVVPHYFVLPETKYCPFYERVNESREDAICKFTNEYSEYGDLESLVWDGIKNCGINIYNDIQEEWSAGNHPNMTKARQYLEYDNSQMFLKNLISEIMLSPSGEVEHNGQVFVLDNNIRESIEREEDLDW